MTKFQKSVVVFLMMLLINYAADGQELSPVTWQFSTKEINDTLLAIHLTAIIQAPYHIYSQNSPEGVTLPTKIVFNRNPLLSVQGACQEEGKLEQSIVEGLRLSYYERRVSFIQLVKLKANVKTKISGKIEFMACTSTHCLPPKVQPFLITLNEPR